MKKYCCYCIRIKKNTKFNSVVEYFSANTIVSDSGSMSNNDDNNVNKNSLLSALYEENPLHGETAQCSEPIASKNSSLLPSSRRNNSSDGIDNTSTWRFTK